MKDKEEREPVFEGKYKDLKIQFYEQVFSPHIDRALMEYANSEGYESPYKYPEEEFKNIFNFWIKQLNLALQSRNKELIEKIEELRELTLADNPKEVAYVWKEGHNCALNQISNFIRPN